jgi:hypothetical protein
MPQQHQLNDDNLMHPSQLEPLSYDQPLNEDQHMDFSFGMGPPAVAPPPMVHAPMQSQMQGTIGLSVEAAANASLEQYGGGNGGGRRSMRNPSVISYGNAMRNRDSIRNMSVSSEATFGRAMSGLSALSIDWENLEDFDLEVDHSSHINNAAMGNKNDGSGPRRSSVRRSFLSMGESKV